MNCGETISHSESVAIHTLIKWHQWQQRLIEEVERIEENIYGVT